MTDTTKIAEALRDMIEAAEDAWGSDRPCVRIAKEELAAYDASRQKPAPAQAGTVACKPHECDQPLCRQSGVCREAALRAQAGTVEGLAEAALVKCLVESGCVGTVKMSYESGPYDITRPSINASRLADAIVAALASRAAAPVPAGWRLVPEVPTREMIDAGAANVNMNYHQGNGVIAGYCYMHMLAAAPHPQAAPGNQGDNQ